MGTFLNTQTHLYPRHYHGDLVRWLFLTNSIVLLIAFPIFKTVTIIPVVFGTILAIGLMLLAALTTSKYKWVHIVNMLVALVCVAIFEILAFATNFSTDPFVFLIRQGIALSFLLSLYFSARTVLGIFSKKQQILNVTAEPGDASETSNEELLEEIKERNELRQ